MAYQARKDEQFDKFSSTTFENYLNEPGISDVAREQRHTAFVQKFEETTKRLPHLNLVEGQEWTYSPNTSFRGPERVLVQWDPAQNP